MWEVWSLSPGIYWSPGVYGRWERATLPPSPTTNCLLKSNYLRQTTLLRFPTLIFPNCSFVSENWCLEQATVVKYCVILPLYLLFYKKLNRARQACSWPGIPSRRLLCVTKHSRPTPQQLSSSPVVSVVSGLGTLGWIISCNREIRKWAIWPQSECGSAQPGFRAYLQLEFCWFIIANAPAR